MGNYLHTSNVSIVSSTIVVTYMIHDVSNLALTLHTHVSITSKVTDCV